LRSLSLAIKGTEKGKGGDTERGLEEKGREEVDGKGRDFGPHF
jgi:hypothetical protein